MNRWSEIRANLIEALKGLDELAGIPVEPIDAVSSVWALPDEIAIGVARPGSDWMLKEHDLNEYEEQPSFIRFDVVVKTDSPQDNADGLTGAGQSEDIAWAILKVRPISIGVPGETGGVFLVAIQERVLISKDRAEGGAGPIAQVISFRTTELTL